MENEEEPLLKLDITVFYFKLYQFFLDYRSLVWYVVQTFSMVH